MRGGSLLLFFCSCFIFSLPLRSDRGRFSRLLFFSSLSLLLLVFFGCSDGMEREACVCDHGYERSDLCAEIIIIIIIMSRLKDNYSPYVVVVFFTLTDRASTIPRNTSGCQSGTWSAGQKKIRGISTKLQ